MNRPILYSFRRCPYAMRARMALYYSRQICELREVVLKDKPPEMLAVSEKGTVPVLVLGDGSVIDESLDVMHWALAQHDPDLWGADLDDVERANMHPLIERNDGYFTGWLNRYKYADRHPEASQQEYFDKCGVFLHELEASLVKDDAELYFVSSPKVSFLDVAIFPFVRQFFAVDLNYTQGLALPKLKAWHDYLINLSLFKNSMTKYPMWTASQTEILEFGFNE